MVRSRTCRREDAEPGPGPQLLGSQPAWDTGLFSWARRQPWNNLQPSSGLQFSIFFSDYFSFFFCFKLLHLFLLCVSQVLKVAEQVSGKVGAFNSGASGSEVCVPTHVTSPAAPTPGLSVSPMGF